MNEDDILANLEDAVRTVFDEYDGPVTLQTGAADVKQWDSLSNVQFIVMVEQAVGVQFSTIEIAELNNLGDFVRLIQKKL